MVFFMISSGKVELGNGMGDTTLQQEKLKNFVGVSHAMPIWLSLSSTPSYFGQTTRHSNKIQSLDPYSPEGIIHADHHRHQVFTSVKDQALEVMTQQKCRETGWETQVSPKRQWVQPRAAHTATALLFYDRVCVCRNAWAPCINEQELCTLVHSLLEKTIGCVVWCCATLVSVSLPVVRVRRAAVLSYLDGL
jgi:hypothetical protein